MRAVLRARKVVGALLAPCALILGALILGACGGGHEPRRDAGPRSTGESVMNAQQSANAEAERARQQQLDRDFPLHGLVTGMQLVVRVQPDPTSTTVGWLRIGSRIRLKRERVRTPTCNTGWYAIYPTGYTCAGEGVEVGETPPAGVAAPEDGAEIVSGRSERFVIDPPARDAPLPYRYYFVKDELTPEYHRIPSRDEQRDALAWRDRLLQLLREDPRRAERFRAGTLPGEPTKPLIVRAYLDRGFFVAGSGVEVRASRRFVRTVRGRYLKEASLEPRVAAAFHGVELTAEVHLPLAWAVRAAQPMSAVTLPDGNRRFADDPTAPVLERLSLVPWARRERNGDRMLHVLADGHFVRDWFLAVAERIDPPPEMAENEPWVHVDLGEQTLVLYRGREPVYATLVSSGLVGHDTPTGLYRIRAKHVAETMANIGGDADDRYAIEDVPWTEYFSGSLALHAAFWHERFGLKRSHGCVNLAPRDARRVFEHTWPPVPEGWHGVSTDRTGLPASHVLVTD